MGVVQDTYVALPGDGGEVDAAGFVALVATVLAGAPPAGDADELDGDGASPRWLAPPFAVLTGPLVRRFNPWDLATDGTPRPSREPQPVVAWAGDDPAQLLAALARALAAPGACVCVWFHALEHDNEAMWPALDHEPAGECAGAIYYLDEPDAIALVNAYVDDDEAEGCSTRVYLRVTGKSAPTHDDLLATPLGDALLDAFGDTAWSGTSAY